MPALLGRVGRGVRRQDLARDRRHVDDRAALALGDQALPERARHQERADEVRLDHVAPDVDIDLRDRLAILAACGTGVVDHEVDPAEVRHRLVGQRLDRRRVAHVADHRQRPRPGRLDLLRDRGDVAPAGRLLIVGVARRVAPRAREHDVAARLGQIDRDGPADAAHPPRARHDRHLAVESRQYCPRPSVRPSLSVRAGVGRGCRRGRVAPPAAEDTLRPHPPPIPPLRCSAMERGPGGEFSHRPKRHKT